MLSNHLIFCRPFLLLLSIFLSIRVFSNESALCIRWPKYWSFNFSMSPSSEYSGLISFSIDWLDLLVVQGTLKRLLQHHSLKVSALWPHCLRSNPSYLAHTVNPSVHVFISWCLYFHTSKVEKIIEGFLGFFVLGLNVQCLTQHLAPDSFSKGPTMTTLPLLLFSPGVRYTDSLSQCLLDTVPGVEGVLLH